MIWKGNEIKTIGDLLDKGINQCKTKEEAQEFMRLYREVNPHADENVGYLSGYFPPEEMARIQDWFGVSHPNEDQ